MAATDLRKEYMRHGLSEADLDPDPIRQFTTWFDTAIRANVIEPNAMALATADRDGRPSARMVLLRGYHESGFVFFTNYDSRKGRELADNPWAALLFFWDCLERQVRIEGPVTRTTAQESDAYYRSRPIGNRLGAWASRQSAVIPGREYLEQEMRELQQRYPGNDVPRPEHWGGYRLRPLSIEFWQGRENRLHDRLRYVRVEPASWRIERLSP